MFYNSKSIKINFICRKLYEHAYLALEKDKPILSNLYIKEHFGPDAAKKVAKFTFNQLFVRVIENIQLYNRTRIAFLRSELMINDRLNELKEIIGIEQDKNTRSNLSFRVSPVVIQQIKVIRDTTGLDTLSEVCELAIMLYITQIDDEAYELMKITLKEEFHEV